VGIILLVLLLALILGGLGFAVHILWWIALVVIVIWLIGFVVRMGEGTSRGRGIAGDSSAVVLWKRERCGWCSRLFPCAAEVSGVS
jgi:hypothetical protein